MKSFSSEARSIMGTPLAFATARSPLLGNVCLAASTGCSGMTISLMPWLLQPFRNASASSGLVLAACSGVRHQAALIFSVI